ncbi:MAG TPA: SAM-dependent chlorinase/fluorinase [Verrucomicrobiae bacterium]|nr:SAM-dependent chlorinase/fluorinase [Verrucomicrobiae bacterium]
MRPRPRARTIALLTDFGTRDPYAASMKGVLRLRAPQAVITDLSHEITPLDVRGAGYFLEACFKYYPQGTVFVAVVDPGVGTARKIVAVDTGRYVFIAPDNGLLGFLAGLFPKLQAHTVSRAFAAKISNTFHGRDIMAPAAAYLASGGRVASLGPRLKTLRRFPEEKPTRRGNKIRGKIVRWDSYGNAITNLRESDLKSWSGCVVRAGKIVLRGLVPSYGHSRSRFCALINSEGRLEIASPMGSAQKISGLKVGAVIEVTGHAG